MMLRMTAATPASPSDLVPALGHDLADRRIAILRHIAAGHSISQAAREAGVSYKAAWQALDVLTNLAGRALVERSVGGAGGGGARITQGGRAPLGLARSGEGRGGEKGRSRGAPYHYKKKKNATARSPKSCATSFWIRLGWIARFSCTASCRSNNSGPGPRRSRRQSRARGRWSWLMTTNI